MVTGWQSDRVRLPRARPQRYFCDRGGGGEETQVVDSLQVGNWGYWALAKSGIYYVDSSVKPRPAIKFVDLRTSRTSTIATVRNTTAWEPALAIAPDESALLYVQLDD